MSSTLFSAFDESEKRMVDETLSESFWDIAAPLRVDKSTVEYNYYRYTPQETNITGLEKFKFVVSDVDRWMLPSKGFIRLRVEILKTNADGNLGRAMVLANPAGHVAISACSYKIDTAEVENNANYQYLAALVHQLTNYSPDYLKQAEQYGFALDTLPHAWSPTVTNDSGFEKRAELAEALTPALVTTPVTFNVIVPLNELFAIHRDVPIAMIGARHEILITKNREFVRAVQGVADSLVTSINITDAELLMPFVTPSNETNTGLFALQSTLKLLPYAYNRYEVFQDQVLANNSTSLSWNVTNINNQLQSVFVFFLTSKNTVAGVSPTMMTNRNLTSIQLRIGTSYFPVNGLNCKFPTYAAADGTVLSKAGENAFEAYENYLVCCGKGVGNDNGVILSYRDFIQKYTIFSFDLTRTDENIFSGGKNLIIEAKFGTRPENGTKNHIATIPTCVIVYKQKVFINTSENKVIVASGHR